MKKYVAFSGGDLTFLCNAGLPVPLQKEGTCNFKALRYCYVPETYAPLDPEQALWMKQYMAERQGQGWGVGKLIASVPTLLSELRKDHIFLPLDNIALCFAQQHNIPYEIPTDWLAVQHFYAAPKVAYAQINRWLAKYDAREFGWKENWFEYDKYSLVYLAQTATMAESFVPVLAKKARSLVVLCKRPASVLPTMWGNEVPQTIWKAALSAITTELTYPAIPAAEHALEGVSEQDYSIMQDAVTLALYENHFPRHNNIIAATMQQTNRPVALGLLHCRWNSVLSQKTLLGEAPIADCPTVVIPAYSGTKADVLPSEVKRLQQSMQGYFPFAEHLDFMFKDFMCTRFYNLECMYDNLRNLWEKYRPVLCVAENIAHGEQCIPLVLAQTLDIPSISLPHGTMYAPVSLRAVPATSHCFCTPMQLREWKDYVDTEAECVCLQELDMNTSYAHPSDIQYHFPENKKVILVIVGVTLTFTPLLQEAYMPHMRSWMMEMNTPPEDLQNEVLVLYKLHPGFTDYGLMNSAGIDDKYILPKDSSLPDLLPHVEMLVACEYISSPSLLGFESKIPMVHCVNKYGSSKDISTENNSLIINASQPVTTPSELWPKIRTLLHDRAKKDAIIERQYAFLQEYMRPKDSGWAEHMEKIIIKKILISQS